MTTVSVETQQLTIEQQTAKTVFENDLLDARETLIQLTTRSLVLDWSWYEQWTVQPLRKSLQDAQRVGLPSTTPIGAYDPIPFREAAREAVALEKQLRQAYNVKDDRMAAFRNAQTPANVMRFEKMREAFTRGLTGDKLRIMNEEVLIQAVVYAQDPPKFLIGYYGEGKKLLTRPEDFASASIWGTADYDYAADDTSKREPHWRATIHHFRGDTLVSTTEHRGPGKTAPPALFH